MNETKLSTHSSKLPPDEGLHVLITEFRQETNSFNPVKSDLAFWRENGWVLAPDAVHGFHKTSRSAVDGMLDELDRSAPGSKIHYGPAYYSQSGGTADQDVMEAYIDELLRVLANQSELDLILFSFHGALQTTTFDDTEAEVLRLVRQVVGERVVISVSTDMHGFISRPFAERANIICGYLTYPHVDIYETGVRATRLALQKFGKPADQQHLAWVPIPMIVSASAYNTLDGPFAELLNYAKSLIDTEEISDVSVYQMQPWLDVRDPHSTVIVIANGRQRATHYANVLAAKLYSLRHTFGTKLATVDEAIDLAERRDVTKPVILVDSADSTNAGAPGDSMAVAQRLLGRNSALTSATVVSDVGAVKKAHEVGVGATASFVIGGSIDSRVPHITATGYVRSLHDGTFRPEVSGHTGNLVRLGRAAVIQFGSLNVLACERIQGNGDPQMYRAFGIEPSLYDLIVVKANTSFRSGYAAIGGTIIPVDTPGAASANVAELPFRHLQRTIFPWLDVPFTPRAEIPGATIPD